jgi:hypothetical protein
LQHTRQPTHPHHALHTSSAFRWPVVMRKDIELPSFPRLANLLCLMQQSLSFLLIVRILLPPIILLKKMRELPLPHFDPPVMAGFDRHRG